MNTKQIALPLVVVLAVLLAFSSPAVADYSGDKPLVTYDQGLLKDGGIVYETVTDASTYTILQAEPEFPWVPLPSLTQQITITIPDGATVKMARLYNYYTWSTADKGDGSNPGMPAEADISFNGVQKVCKHGLGDGLANRGSLENPIDYGNGVIQYWDSKGQGYDINCNKYAKKYDNPYGTFAWDVTDMVTGSGTYTAKIQNADSTPTAGLPGKPYKYWERFVTWGFGLVVVYEYQTGSVNVEYWIDEGCDLLLNRTCYETAESATATAPFDGVVNWGDPAHEPWDRQRGDLTTVVMGPDKGNAANWPASKNMNYFNGLTTADQIGPCTVDPTLVYPFTTKAIGVNNFVDVPLIHEDNIAYFQDRALGTTSGDNIVVSNAFLVVEKLSKGQGPKK